MKIKVTVFTVLSKHTDGQRDLEIEVKEGADFAALLQAISVRFPLLGERLFFIHDGDTTSKLNRNINFFVGEEDIRHLQQLETPLTDGAEVSFVSAVAGG